MVEDVNPVAGLDDVVAEQLKAVLDDDLVVEDVRPQIASETKSTGCGLKLLTRLNQLVPASPTAERRRAGWTVHEDGVDLTRP